MDKQIIENVATIATGSGETDYERLLTETGMKQYAQIGMQTAKEFQVVAAYVLHKYVSQKGKSSEQVEAYQEALSDFQGFFIECAKAATAKEQLEAGNNLSA